MAAAEELSLAVEWWELRELQRALRPPAGATAVTQ